MDPEAEYSAVCDPFGGAGLLRLESGLGATVLGGALRALLQCQEEMKLLCCTLSPKRWSPPKTVEVSWGEFWPQFFAIPPGTAQAYDQNHDGVIGLEEFMQAHGILQNALRLNPAKGGDVDPAVLKGDLQHCYLGIGHEGVRP